MNQVFISQNLPVRNPFEGQASSHRCNVFITSTSNKNKKFHFVKEIVRDGMKRNCKVDETGLMMLLLMLHLDICMTFRACVHVLDGLLRAEFKLKIM